MQARGVCGASFWRDADELADSGADTVGTDDQVVGGLMPVGELDVARGDIEVFALFSHVSQWEPFDRRERFERDTIITLWFTSSFTGSPSPCSCSAQSLSMACIYCLWNM